MNVVKTNVVYVVLLWKLRLQRDEQRFRWSDGMIQVVGGILIGQRCRKSKACVSIFL